MGRDREAPKAQVYPSQDDRDLVVEGTYTLSGEILAFMGGRPKSVLAAIDVHITALVEAFNRRTGGTDGRLDDELDRWCVRHFGRVLEPAARMLLKHEVMKTITYQDGGRRIEPGGVYASWSEQKAWEAAEAATPRLRPGESHLARLEAICERMGVSLGPGPQPMPSAYDHLGRTAEFNRLEELRSQAARIVDDEGPDEVRLPYRDPE